MRRMANEKQVTDVVEFSGHENVLSLHTKSIEITKAAEISRRADCIIGVKANKGCSDLDRDVRDHIQKGGRLKFSIIVGREVFEFLGIGSPLLTLSDPLEIVLRKSEFISSRTGAIHCSASASDLPRKIVQLLKDPASAAKLVIEGC